MRGRVGVEVNEDAKVTGAQVKARWPCIYVVSSRWSGIGAPGGHSQLAGGRAGGREGPAHLIDAVILELWSVKNLGRRLHPETGACPDGLELGPGVGVEVGVRTRLRERIAGVYYTSMYTSIVHPREIATFKRSLLIRVYDPR